MEKRTECKKIVICLLFCLLLTSCFLIPNKIHVEGVVTDALNGSPIAGASVTLSGERRGSLPGMVSYPDLASTTTDNNGYYSLSREKDRDLGGILKIWFRASGYETLVPVISNSTGDHVVNAQLIPIK
jgi:hypothetical protein